ncbi:MAG: cytochrome P450 [Myxococcales bacterium]|nr:cytochrome P450 [Myxococcales bacterium]
MTVEGSAVTVASMTGTGLQRVRASARRLLGASRLGAEWISTGVTYNPLAPRVIQDPYPTYAWLRARDPVHYSGLARGWLLLRHEDVERALRDHERLSSDDRHDPLLRARDAIVETRSMLTLDAPDHTRLRGLVMRAFTPAAIRAMRPRVEALVAEHLDALAGHDETELLDALARPLPVRVIAELLGIPSEDLARFRRWSDALARTLEPMKSESVRGRGRAAERALRAYFAETIARRLGRERGDLLSALLRARDEQQDRLSADELLALLRLLLVAGNRRPRT